MVKVTQRNSITGKKNSMTLDITKEQLRRWANGELIQDVMPNLTPEEREFLITGMSLAEQKQLYGEEE